MNTFLAIGLQKANGHYWPRVLEDTRTIFDTSKVPEASMDIYISGIRSSVFYTTATEVPGVVTFDGAAIGHLALSERIETLGPWLLRRTVTTTASAAMSYYVVLTYYPAVAGTYCSYASPHPISASHQQQTDTLFPMVGIRNGGVVYGAFMGSAAFIGNQGFQQIDPVAQVLTLQNGDARPPGSEGVTQRSVTFSYSRTIAANETQTWVTYIFRSPARNHYDVQLAAHLALAEAKGWSRSAAEAVAKTTTYLLTRENLLEWGNRCSVIIMSGIGYGWEQWTSDVFWNYLALGGPLDIGQSAFNGLFFDRFYSEDNALLYMIFAGVLRRAGGTICRDQVTRVYEYIRAREVNGGYVPKRVVFQDDGPTVHFNYRTYMDFMFYEDGDVQSSNQGFFCLALTVAKELGFPVTQEEIDGATQVYQSMFNVAAGFISTSVKRPTIVSQDALMGEVLAFALFGRSFLSDERVQKHVATIDAAKTSNGLKVFCHGDGSFLDPAEYGLPGFPNADILSRGQGNYEAGGSWFLCDALTYLAGTIHGMDTEAQQLSRIQREMLNSPSFKEFIGTISGADGGNALYGWNGAYVYLRELVRKRMGLRGADPLFEQLDAALGIQLVDGWLVLNPDKALLPSQRPRGLATQERLPPPRALATAPGWSFIDDADLRVEYIAKHGTWQTDPDIHCIADTQHYTRVVGNMCSLEFTGSRVSVIYYIAPGMGLMEVSIDSEVRETIDCNASTVHYQQESAYGLLDAASHTITLRHAGRGSSPSSDPYIAIDGFNVPSIKEVDDASGQITYTVIAGSDGWHTDPDLHCLNGTQHYTHGVGNTAGIEFMGDFIEILYYIAPNMGLMEIIIDTGVSTVIDCHSITPRYQITKRLAGFGMGKHGVAVRHGGRGSAPSAQTYIVLDAFRYSNLS